MKNASRDFWQRLRVVLSIQPWRNSVTWDFIISLFGSRYRRLGPPRGRDARNPTIILGKDVHIPVRGTSERSSWSSRVVTFLHLFTKTSSSGAVLGSQRIANMVRLVGGFVTIHDLHTSHIKAWSTLAPLSRNQDVMSCTMASRGCLRASSGLLPHWLFATTRKESAVEWVER